MGQTSAGMIWSVRIHADTWDDCYDEPCMHKECDRHLRTRLRPAYYKVRCIS